MALLIASFDVGVKNLAYCVMHYKSTNESGKQYPIEAWNCIDLTCPGEAEPLSHCMQLNKSNGKKCTQLAKIVTDDGLHYCMRHNPDKDKYTIKKKTKVASLSYETIGNRLMDHLESMEDTLWNRCDHVIIEQQFSKNRRMIFLSAILFSYFLQRGQRNPQSKISKVKFASSRNKLLVYDGPEINERTRKNDKDHRKWIAVKHCEWMLRGDEKYKEFLNKFPKKKDDLSDSFLQGADYLKNDCRVKHQRKKIIRKKK